MKLLLTNLKLTKYALLFLFVSMVGMFLNHQVFSSAGTVDADDNKVFLPQISYEVSIIYGQVTFGNLGPWPDVELDLRFFNGSEWSTLSTTRTDSNGIYTFTNVPSLESGQRYYVRYLNTKAEGFLYTWHTKPITTFKAGQQIHGGDFSIAGVSLFAPPPGAHYVLPVDFIWNKRSGHLTDSYELNIFEPVTGSPYFYTDPPLGYVEEYTLNSLPPGFLSGNWYVWNIWVYGEDGNSEGNWGISYWTYYIRLESAPNSDIRDAQRISSAQLMEELVDSGQYSIELDLGK